MFHVSNVRQVYYQGFSFHHPYFLAGELELDKGTLLLVSFHFDWPDNMLRRQQINQLIDFSQKYKYSILMGDTNPENYI